MNKTIPSRNNVYGIWNNVYGIWNNVYGTWNNVYGTRFQICRIQGLCHEYKKSNIKNCIYHAVDLTLINWITVFGLQVVLKILISSLIVIFKNLTLYHH